MSEQEAAGGAIPHLGAEAMTRRIAIMAVFFLHATAVGAIYPRIPDIQTGLGLSKAELGLMLVGQPTGGFISVLFASWLIERLGPKAIITAALPVVALALVCLALAPSLQIGFACGLVFGLGFAATNMAMNVEADRVEAITGKRLMNRCHGVWSLGVLLSSSLSAVLRGFEVSPFLHFLGVLGFLFAGALLLVRFMRPSPPRLHAGAPEKKKVFALPTRNTLLLSGILLAGVVPDSAVRAWSIIFMRDTFSAPDWVDSLTLPAFVLLLASGRLVGDTIVTRFGATRSAAGLIVVALSGLALVLWAPGLYVVLVGFALMGLGISIQYPLVMSAGARLGDRPASENVTAISLVNNMVNLGTPALIGFLADAFGIRAAFGLLVPVLLLAFVLTPRLAASERN